MTAEHSPQRRDIDAHQRRNVRPRLITRHYQFARAWLTCSSDSLRGLPTYAPRRLAAAIPAFVRSETNSRFDEVRKGPAQSVQLPHRQHIAAMSSGERIRKSRPLCGRA